jgi:putative aldouronate transport system substrate-binding protein
MKKGLISLIAILFVVSIILTGCTSSKNTADKAKVSKKALDNLNKTGMPIVKKPLKLDFFTGKSLTNVKADWNNILIWNTYKDMTKIDVNWTQIPGDSLAEKRNLALAGGDLPDVFYASRMPNTDLLKYGSQGVFLPLNDLIDKYAPNFKKLMDENPAIKKAITFPDGNIYSLPNLYDPNFTSLLMNATPWINKKWLDELGMKEPTTTDEFYQYLKAVKGTDLNKNGKNDEVPFGAYSMSYLNRWLRGSFGIGNRGVSYIDLDPETNKVRFYVTTDRYKEMLEYMNKLYSEGLIEQDIYSLKLDKFLSNAQADQYGSTYWYSPPQEFGKVGENFEGLGALKGPHGDQKYYDVSNPVTTIGQFVITKHNPNPAATMRWIDYFYGDEGTKFFYMGIEGKTYEKAADGSLKYVDSITNNPDGSTMNENLVKYLAWVGSSPASIIKQKYFQGTESSPVAVKEGQKLKPFFGDETWPNQFLFTKDEASQFDALSADIQKYVDEMTDKFITGKAPFSDWDKYKKELDNMGLKDYMKIQQAAYERYSK